MVRDTNADAYLVCKLQPHIDGELRPNIIAAKRYAADTDQIIGPVYPEPPLEQLVGVWTVTFTFGFEALVRSKTVLTYGAPFMPAGA